MKKILVPTDFTAYADSALDFAVQLSQKNGAEIELLHVIEYPLAKTFNVSGEITTWDPMDKVFTLELIKKSKADLNKAASKYEGQVKIEETLLIGNPFEGIGDQLEESDIDLVVMGTKGATGLQEVLVGSNAEKVVRNSTCPVISIHQERKPDDIDKILFATDLELGQDHVLKELVELQQLLNAELHLLWVNTPHSIIDEETAKEQLEKIANRLNLERYSVHVGKGFHPEEGILSFAQTIDADMIGMATHSHKGLLHLFLGSIAEDVVNHATIPVWTYSSKSKN